MDLQYFFQIPQPARNNLIENGIVLRLPQEDREKARERAARIVNGYVAFDSSALRILSDAAQRGRFDEFAQKLEKHYEKSVAHLAPGVRTVPDIPGTMETHVFFDRCDRELSTYVQN